MGSMQSVNDCIKHQKMVKLISIVLALLLFSYAVAQNKDWCTDTEDYFVEHCPIQRGDYNGCCLCTQYYYYSCDCCKDVVGEIGVMGDCSKWGTPTGHDEFCIAPKI